MMSKFVTCLKLSALGGAVAAGVLAAQPSEKPAAETGVAVVELFTSEGCSSCPPADAALKRLVDANRGKDSRVFALSFHVDYWDRLGWPDPHASRAATERQYAYAKAMDRDGVYTPQTVVNGTAEFVGSDEERLKSEVRSALATPAAIALKARTRQAGDRVLRISVETEQATRTDLSLTAVALLRESTTVVRRGENAGKTLHHSNVVVAMKAQPLQGATTELSLELPEKLDVKDVDVVVLAHAAGSMKVLGAARATAGPAEGGTSSNP